MLTPKVEIDASQNPGRDYDGRLPSHQQPGMDSAQSAAPTAPTGIERMDQRQCTAAGRLRRILYPLLSLAPAIVIAVAVAALVYGQEAAQGRLASEIQGIAGSDVARTIQEIITRADQPRAGTIASLLGLAILAFGASSVFVELHDAMNTIWHVALPVDRSNAATVIRLIRHRFYSFAMVLGIGFLLLVSLVLTAGIAAMGIAVPRAAPFIILYLVAAVLFAALYKIVLDVGLKWSDVAPGALITALLFMLGKQLLGRYFAHASLG